MLESVPSVIISVQNTGSSTVTINSAYIDSEAVTFAGVNNLGTASDAIAKGTSSTFTLTLPTSGSLTSFTVTAQYTIKLLTAKGNTVTTTYTYAGS